MSPHIKIVAILNLVFYGLSLLVIGLLATVFLGAGLLSGSAEDFGFSVGLVTIVGGFLGIFTIPGILAGIGLLQKKEWARILGIILAFFELIQFPFGTALGIYMLWVLFHGETTQIFAQANRRHNVSTSHV